MCGRYTLTETDPRRVARRFELDEHRIDHSTLGRYNVCPTETVLISTSDGSRDARWGLLPSWTRRVGKGPLLINARAETVATKAPFAGLLSRPERRCLVLTDGWYEWLRPERPKGRRVPFRYTVDDGAPFAFAGLWCRTRLDGRWLISATILTTSANAICRPVHDRMPCVLADREAEAAWLAGDVDASAALELLEPLADLRCSAAPANPAVGRAGVEGPELLVAPAGGNDPDQLTLA